MTLPASEALQRLIEGNRRFASGTATVHPAHRTRPEDTVEKQEPFAIVLGCSDSRVPAEIVFDQGLGDLFVIRVAGNIVAPSQVGSVEFAANFGTRLVVVLGHTRCGAVLATINELKRGRGGESRNLRSIVDRVRPAVEPLYETHPDGGDFEDLWRRAARANTRASVSQLRHGSQILEELIERDGLMVVGAEYSLETGEVDFFDRP
ncbi:MAG: carbonic anhydrase [Acidobacteria bacterium]|nr:MAG: carbonic anhydrase [Acidobacteriota bacterium]REK11486.1 MAG: carbonic anhydrase [Acidobacteriota bacterium]